MLVLLLTARTLPNPSVRALTAALRPAHRCAARCCALLRAAHRAAPYSPSRPNSHFKTLKRIFIIDVFQITELAPLAELLGDPHVVKIIHNAAFEKGVLAPHGITIRNIADTLC